MKKTRSAKDLALTLILQSYQKCVWLNHLFVPVDKLTPTESFCIDHL